MPVRLNSSGGGSVTLDVPAVGTTTTLNLPTANGTLLASDGSGNVTVSGAATFSGNATFNAGLIPSSSFLRNRIINGQQQVDQRNNGASVTFGAGTAFPTDRNGVFNAGPNAITAQAVAGAVGFQTALRITGSASNAGVSWYQRIEANNSFDLAGVAVTFSAWVWASSARSVTPIVTTPNSFQNFSSQTAGPSTTWAVTTTPTRFSWTFTMPANAVNGAEMAIQLGGLLAADTVTLTGVQLEVGSVATPFERRLFGTELMLCQRYFQVYGTGMLGRWTNANLFEIFASRPTMRATPTMSLNSTTAFMFRVGLEAFFATGVAIVTVNSSPNGTGLVMSKTGGGSPNAGEFAALMQDVLFANAEL